MEAERIWGNIWGNQRTFWGNIWGNRPIPLGEPESSETFTMPVPTDRATAQVLMRVLGT